MSTGLPDLKPPPRDLPAPAARRELTGIAASLLLHGIGLGLVLLFLAHQAHRPEPPLKPLFIDLIQEVPLARRTTAPPAPVHASKPQQIATKGPHAAPKPVGVRPNGTKPYTDPFEIRLRQLARLRNPNSTLRLETQGNAAQTASSQGEQGELAYSVRDAIRARVLRKWNLDLSELGRRKVIITLHVVLTGNGKIAAISIAGEREHKHDLAWTDIALSARNAVMLSAPFTLPYRLRRHGFSFTLRLDPHATQR